jgi:hypothetical protein
MEVCIEIVEKHAGQMTPIILAAFTMVWACDEDGREQDHLFFLSYFMCMLHLIVAVVYSSIVLTG